MARIDARVAERVSTPRPPAEAPSPDEKVKAAERVAAARAKYIADERARTEEEPDNTWSLFRKKKARTAKVAPASEEGDVSEATPDVKQRIAVRLARYYGKVT
jgi:hypothetical protein